MKKVIGVIGTIASGKDTVADYIAEILGVKKYEISSTLKEIASERGIEITRDNLISLGREIAQTKGADYLARTLLEKIEESAVVSGMRQKAQIEFFKKHSDFFLIAVDASPEVRFARAKSRGKLGEARTVEEFIKNEEAENSGSVQRLFDCMKEADIRIDNNGSLEDIRSVLAPYFTT